MDRGTLDLALEREHREIDGGIEAYLAELATGRNDPDPLQRSMSALRRHIYLEEEFLFPPLRAAGMMGPIFVMLREHGELWETMDAIDNLLADPASGADVAGPSRSLLAQLQSHNSKEEPILYAQADAVLPPEAAGRLSAFLENGTMPAGWVCHQVNQRR